MTEDGSVFIVCPEKEIFMKKAMVTGASEGIGHALAKKLAAQGYQITGVARSEDKLKTLVAELGDGHDYIVADLADSNAQDLVIRQLEAQPYDLLINNAGVGTSGAFTEVALDRQVALLRLNVEALARLSHAYLSKARSGDALVNVSSVLAFLPMPYLGIYSATKSFVTAFSEALWYEQKKRGVYVMALHPGMTATNFQTNAGGKKGDVPENMAQTPDQVADACLSGLSARSKPVVVSGARNQFFCLLPRLMSSKLIVTMMGATSKRSQSGH
jgi:short-subunit dehydrogenase